MCIKGGHGKRTVTKVNCVAETDPVSDKISIQAEGSGCNVLSADMAYHR